MVGQGQFTKQRPAQSELEDETAEQKEARLKDLKEKEEEQKAKAFAKRKAKPFEESAKRSMLDPEFKQWGTQCVTDARAMIQKITSKLEEIDSSDMQQEKALYDSAITTLKFRLECLKQACSFDGD